MSKKIKLGVTGYGLWRVLPAIAILILGSCGQKRKPEHPKSPSSTAAVKDKPVLPTAGPDNISLFELTEFTPRKGDTVIFVSLSDVDTLSRKIDSLVIPDIRDKKPEETEFLSLKSRYRKRLFKSTGIAETDTLFIYDYANDALLKLPVGSLSTIASLSPYEDVSEGLHTETSYMLGFEIDRASFSGRSNNYVATSYVYIGAKNPFTKSQMHPIIWEKTNPGNIPQVSLHTDEKKTLEGFKLSGTYRFQSDGFHFYLQEFLKNEESPAERILVTNNRNELVHNALYYQTEDSSPASLSFKNNNKNELQQWTGRLLSDKPPVIFGVEDVSFGCPVINFLDKSGHYLDLKCDNRH